MASVDQKYLSCEKDLAETLRGLVKPIRRQYETKEEQANCLFLLGEIYLEESLISKQASDLIKASALFNAALARSSSDDVKKKMRENLVKVKIAFMDNFYPHATPITPEQWNQVNVQNKQILQKLRASAFSNSSNLENVMKKYDQNAPNRPEMEKKLVKEAESVSSLLQEEMIMFIKMLWEQAEGYADTALPCKYAMMGLGSLARQEVTPYSDLEFAILVEEQSEYVQEYFANLTYLFHLIVLDLGETPLPMVGIASLNDFTIPGGDWFYDKLTPSGIKLDGAMPWASKTPIGRPATRTKEPLSLIQTPKAMADLLKSDNMLGQAYHVADVLGRTVLIVGDHDLYGAYNQEVLRIVVETDPEVGKNKGRESIVADIERRNAYVFTSHHISAKMTYYRLPSTFVENLRLCFTPFFIGSSQWSVIENFVREQIFSEEEAFDLKLWVALTFSMRLITYFTYRGQYEKINTYQPQSEPSNQRDTSSSLGNQALHQLSDVKPWFVDMLKSKLDIAMRCTQRHETTFRQKPTYPFKAYFSNDIYCLLYFILAEQDFDIPIDNCGKTCLRTMAESLHWIDPSVDDIDYLLMNKEQCECVSMIETYLKIHKFCLIKNSKKSEVLPDVNMDSVISELKCCIDLRDSMFLTFGLLKMAHFSNDVKALKFIAEYAESLIRAIMSLPKHDTHKLMFQNIENDFYYWLMQIFLHLDEFEKTKDLAEQCLEKAERINQTGGDLVFQSVSIYRALANALFAIPERQDEAITLLEKALSIVDKNVTLGFSYTNMLFSCVYDLTAMLYEKQRYAEIETLVENYFFNDNKPYVPTKDDILRASLVLVRHSYIPAGKLQEASGVCEKSYQMVKVEKLERKLPDAIRYCWAKDYLTCCFHLDKIEDIPKVEDFHRLLCNTQDDKRIASLEHRSFALFILLHFHARDKDIPVPIKTATIDQLNARHLFTDKYIDLLVSLCDTLRDYRRCNDTELLLKMYADADQVLKDITNTYVDKTSFFCVVYLGYRLCDYLSDYALENEAYLFQALEFILMTRRLMEVFFPECITALQWVSNTMDKCIKRYKMLPQGIKQKKHCHISTLVELRNSMMTMYNIKC